MAGMAQPHVYPPLIPRIKENHDGKSDKDFAKLKLCRDPTLPKLDPYKFKMSLFENSNPDEFFLFVRNFNINTGLKI